MLPQKTFVAALALVLCSAGGAHAISLKEAARPASLPPPGYDQSTWVDSRGCTYFRAEAGTWTPAVSDTGAPICGAKAAIGTISPLTGFPVPPGYRVAWQDGRLNPLRGPLSK